MGTGASQVRVVYDGPVDGCVEKGVILARHKAIAPGICRALLKVVEKPSGFLSPE